MVGVFFQELLGCIRKTNRILAAALPDWASSDEACDDSFLSHQEDSSSNHYQEHRVEVTVGTMGSPSPVLPHCFWNPGVAGCPDCVGGFGVFDADDNRRSAACFIFHPSNRRAHAFTAFALSLSLSNEESSALREHAHGWKWRYSLVSFASS